MNYQFKCKNKIITYNYIYFLISNYYIFMYIPGYYFILIITILFMLSGNE